MSSKFRMTVVIRVARTTHRHQLTPVSQDLYSHCAMSMSGNSSSQWSHLHICLQAKHVVA